MSALYPDLPLTNVPELDTFTNFLNIVASDGALIQQYINAMNSGNTVLANQILAQIPSGSQKIIKATDLNKIQQAVLALERFFSTDIFPTIEDQQQTWLDTVNQFSYKGVWSSGTSYEVNNMVTYTTSGITFLYLATTTPPVGTLPNNTQYWRLLTVKGFDGASGVGLSYRQQWSATEVYAVDDAVTYSAALWMAIAPSQGQTPQQNSTFWKLVMVLAGTVYPIQDTPPENQPLNALWFNTSTNPTNYYSSDYFADKTLSNLTDNQNALYNIGAKPNENLLDNWYFVGGGTNSRFPVNQREQSKYTSQGYTCDRWINATEFHLGLTEEGLNTGGIIRQIHEEWQESEWAGNIMTASVLFVGGTFSTYTFVYPSSSENGKESPDGVIKIGRLQGFGWNQPSFGINVGYKTIVAAKLEFGKTQSLARKTETGWELLETPRYANELLKCMRFYQKSKIPFTIIDGECQNVQLFPMRISPTVTTTNSDNITVDYITNSSFRVRNKNTPAITDYNWEASAEL